MEKELCSHCNKELKDSDYVNGLSVDNHYKSIYDDGILCVECFLLEVEYKR